LKKVPKTGKSQISKFRNRVFWSLLSRFKAFKPVCAIFAQVQISPGTHRKGLNLVLRKLIAANTRQMRF